MSNKSSIVASAYVVPGLPHPLLAPDRSPGWASLKRSFAQARAEIEALDADVILYWSSQWLSVLGYLFQANPEPEWTHVDPNWHELGSMPYKFRVDADFAHAYAKEAKALGHYTRAVNYRGFPIDTGVIVAQKLLNPDNRLKAAMVSCNMYAEKQETLSMGQAAARALASQGKRAVVVVVSSLSARFEIQDIDPAQDKVSSLKDDEWNRKILEIFGEGRLEDVSEVAREYSKQANADMGFKGIWWLNGLCGKSNDFEGRIFDYQPIWGSGAAIVGLKPKAPIRPVAGWGGDEADLVERSAAKATGERVGFADTYVPPSTDDRHVSARGAPPPVGPYPHARREGEFIFLSGVGPRQAGQTAIPGVTLAADGSIASYDVVAQTHATIANVRAILEAAGSRLEDAVDVQVFLTDMKRDFAAFNKAYAEHFAAIGPTRTTVEVGALPTPIAVELKIIARARG